MGNDQYSKKHIAKRLIDLQMDTGGENKKENNILAKIVHEFGTNPDLYDKWMSDSEIIDTTYEHQTSPSPMETELSEETETILNLKRD